MNDPSEYEVESERVIAFRPEIAKILGSNNAALMYQQIAHWRKYTKNPDGWVYKSTVEMFEETNVTERQQRKAREILVNIGWIEAEKKLANGSPTWHYRIVVMPFTVLKDVSTSLTGETPNGFGETPNGFGETPGATGKNAGSITIEDTRETTYVNFSEDIKKLYHGWLIEFIIGYEAWLSLDAEQRVLAMANAEKKLKLTSKRKDKFRIRLVDAGFKMCAHAIKNIAKSDFHRGENNTGWKVSPEWLFNSYEKIEEWANKKEVR